MRRWGPLLLVIVGVALWGAFVRPAPTLPPAGPVNVAQLYPPQPGASPWPSLNQDLGSMQRAAGLSVGPLGDALLDNGKEVPLFSYRNELTKNKKLLGNETRYALSTAVSGRCLELQGKCFSYVWKSGASYNNDVLTMIGRYDSGHVELLAFVYNDESDPEAVRPDEIFLGLTPARNLAVALREAIWVLEGDTWKSYVK